MGGSEQREGPRPIVKADYEALAAFRHALREFLDFSQAAARRAGLTPQQHQALLAIKGYPGREVVTVRELAERLLLRHHSASGSSTGWRAWASSGASPIPRTGGAS
jgi:hypothetical protein